MNCNNSDSDGSNDQDNITFSASGTIEPGNYLALEHNLESDYLTFDGQFTKDGYIYDYFDYRELFAPIEKKPPAYFSLGGTSLLSSTTLTNGDFVIAYRCSVSGYGTFAIFDENGAPVSDLEVFFSGVPREIKIISLDNGNFVIIYSDNDDSNKGRFIIYDNDGNPVTGPVTFQEEITYSLSAANLNNGTFVIVYSYSISGTPISADFIIYNEDGTLNSGPVTYNNSYTANSSLTKLNNGNLAISYSDNNNSRYGTFVIYKDDGMIVKNPTVFDATDTLETNYPLSSTTLANNNFVITYNDISNSKTGKFVIYDEDGNLLLGPKIFNNYETHRMSVFGLSNGDFVISYKSIEIDDAIPPFNFTPGKFGIFDKNGTTVMLPYIIEKTTFGHSTITELNNGNFVISYTGSQSYCYFGIYSDHYLALEEIDNNEVRLWNRTNETLDLRLSVDR
jgi:hypothetical protein